MPGQDFLYDAFISYSHKADGNLAPALRSGLHRFAKPWWRLRATRIFHDDASMVTDSDLWRSILRALESSRHFVLLASPEAAASPWVRDEINWWLKNRSLETMLIVLSDGDLVWDRQKGNFDWAQTTSFPQDLDHGLTGEPLWLDLRWARNSDELALNNPEFRSAIADLSAALTGRSKDELIGEDVRRHRQTRRIAFGAAASLAVLAILSTLAAFIAVQNRNEAEQQRLVAEDRSRIALSRQLATQSTAALEAGAIDRALLIAVESARALEGMEHPDPSDDHDAWAALIGAVHAQPSLIRYLARGRSASGALISRDGLVTARIGRDIRFWQAIDQPEMTTAPSTTAGALEPENIKDFRAVFPVLSGARSVDPPLTLRDPRTGAILMELDTGQSGALFQPSISADGHYLAVGAGDNSVFLWRSGTPLSQARRLEGHSSNVVSLAFSPDGTRLATASWDRTVRMWETATGRPLDKSPLFRGQAEVVAFSPDGRSLAVGHGGGVSLFEASDLGLPASRLQVSGKVDHLAFSPDGAVLYVAGPGSAKITRLRLDGGSPLPALIGHLDGITSLALDPAGQFLVSTGASGEIVAWRVSHAHGFSSLDAGEGPVGNLAVTSNGASGAVDSCSPPLSGCERVRITRWQLERDTWGRPVPKMLAAVENPSLVRHLTLAAMDDGSVVAAKCARVEKRSSTGCLGLVTGHLDADLYTIGDWTPVETEIQVTSARFDPEAKRIAYLIRDSGARGSVTDWNYYLRVADAASGKRLLDAAPRMERNSGHLQFSAAADEILAGGLLISLETGSFSAEVPGDRAAYGPGGDTVISIMDPLYGATSVQISPSDDMSSPSVIPTVIVGNVVTLATSPGARAIAFGLADGTVALWDSAARKTLGLPLRLSDDLLPSLALAENGKTLMAGTRDGSLLAVDLDPISLLQRACRIAGRNLTFPEWTGLFGDTPYRLTCPGLPPDSSLRQAGLVLAAQGNVAGGAELLERARTLGDSTIADPAAMARNAAAKTAVAQGRKAGETGAYETAVTAFERAQSLGADLPSPPDFLAANLAAEFYLERGSRFAREGDPSAALNELEKARAFKADIQIGESVWAQLCAGSLKRSDAKLALRSCRETQAVTGDRRNYHDLVAVAEYLSGLHGDAAASFQRFFDFENMEMRFRGDRRLPPEILEHVRRWQERLAKGEVMADLAEIADVLEIRRIGY